MPLDLRTLIHIARRTAQAHEVPEAVVCGLVDQESGWDPWAWNPEPRYRWFWNVRSNAPFRKVTDLEISSEVPPADFPTLRGDRDQEWWAQQASWGLCQVMGAVAREHGFRGLYLPELCDPIASLTYGCVHLGQHIKRTGSVAAGLLRYNGGGDPLYPGKVLEKAKKYA